MLQESSIASILCSCDIPFERIVHPESHSCDESKAFRSNKGWINGFGSKNIVFHAKGKWYVVVTHADKSIKARNFKHEFGTKDIRFASQEEMDATVGARIGSVPPFGSVDVEIPYYVDEELFTRPQFYFNPADPTVSYAVSTEDLRKIYSALPNPVRYFRHPMADESEFELIETRS